MEVVIHSQGAEVDFDTVQEAAAILEVVAVVGRRRSR